MNRHCARGHLMSILSIWLLSLVTSTHVLLERDVCGRECLRQVAAYWEVAEANRIDDLLKTSAAPFSIADLTAAADEIGLHAEPVHWKAPSAARFPCPAILHVR